MGLNSCGYLDKTLHRAQCKMVARGFSLFYDVLSLSSFSTQVAGLPVRLSISKIMVFHPKTASLTSWADAIIPDARSGQLRSVISRVETKQGSFMRFVFVLLD
jgi:hypothetical protein